MAERVHTKEGGFADLSAQQHYEPSGMDNSDYKVD